MARIETYQSPNLDYLTYTTAIWDENNKIYLASTSQISLLNSEDFKEVVSKELESVPLQLILTQRHIIICYGNNLLEWLFKFDPDINDEDTKPLEVDKYYTIKDGAISTIMYDHYMGELLIGTQEGNILLLPQPAESNMDDLEDDAAGDKTPSDDDNKKEEKQLELEVRKIGPFHTSEIVYLKELKELDILISVARDGAVFVWNLIDSKKNKLFLLNLLYFHYQKYIILINLIHIQI